MADEADCPVCGGQHPVTWLITHLNPAATIRACEQDFEAAVLALLANRLEVDAGWLTDVINTAIDQVNEQQVVADTPYEQPEQDAAEDPLDPNDDARPYMPVDDEVRTGFPVHDSDAEPVFEDE